MHYKRVFNGLFGGQLSEIIDRNGNATTIAYSANTLTVTDPAGRHLYFNRGGSNPSLVSSVTSDPGSGIGVTYTYQPCYVVGCSPFFGDMPVLTKVTQADNTFVTFVYDSSLMITSVNDTNGKVLEAHFFADACSAGVSSTRANGVDALTLTFPANFTSYCSTAGVGAP